MRSALPSRPLSASALREPPPSEGGKATSNPALHGGTAAPKKVSRPRSALALSGSVHRNPIDLRRTRPKTALGARQSQAITKTEQPTLLATREVYELCEQLRLPQDVVLRCATVASDPTALPNIVQELRHHRTVTLQALRRIDARERILRCLDEIKHEEARCTPRGRQRRLLEAETVREALESSSAAVKEVLREWQEHRGRLLASIQPEDVAPGLLRNRSYTPTAAQQPHVFRWDGVDYMAKMMADTASIVWPTTNDSTNDVISSVATTHSLPSAAAPDATEMHPKDSVSLVHSEAARSQAAAKIQRCFRGHRAKLELFYRRLSHRSATLIARRFRKWRAKLRRGLQPSSHPSARAAPASDAATKPDVEETVLSIADAVEIHEQRRHAAARRIQRFFARIVARSRTARNQAKEMSAAQAIVRRFFERLQITRIAHRARTRRVAATLLQSVTRAALAAMEVSRRHAAWRDDFSSLVPIDVDPPVHVLVEDRRIDVARPAAVVENDTYHVLSPTGGRVLITPEVEDVRVCTGEAPRHDTGEAPRHESPTSPVSKVKLMHRDPTEIQVAEMPPRADSFLRPLTPVKPPPYAVKFRRSMLLLVGNHIVPFFDDRDERPRTNPPTAWAGDYEAALAIQRVFRGSLGRRRAQRELELQQKQKVEYLRELQSQALALLIQNFARYSLSIRWMNRKPSLRRPAARRIQRWWRGLLCRGVVGTKARKAHEEDVLVSSSLVVHEASELRMRVVHHRRAVRVISAWWVGLHAKWSLRRHRYTRAVRVIQRAWRSFTCLRDYYNAKARRHDTEVQQQEDLDKQLQNLASMANAVALDAELSVWQTLHDGALTRLQYIYEEVRKRPNRLTAACKIQHAWRAAASRERCRELLLERIRRWSVAAVAERRNESATRLQAWWRGTRCRGSLSGHHTSPSQETQSRAASILQATVRGSNIRSQLSEQRIRSSVQYAEAQRLRSKLGIPPRPRH